MLSGHNSEIHTFVIYSWCPWIIGLTHSCLTFVSLQENWPKAFYYASVLLKESRWSKVNRKLQGMGGRGKFSRWVTYIFELIFFIFALENQCGVMYFCALI